MEQSYFSSVRIFDRDLFKVGLQEVIEEQAKEHLLRCLDKDGVRVTGHPQIRDWKTESYVTYKGVSMHRWERREERLIPSMYLTTEKFTEVIFHVLAEETP